MNINFMEHVSFALKINISFSCEQRAAVTWRHHVLHASTWVPRLEQCSFTYVTAGARFTHTHKYHPRGRGCHPRALLKFIGPEKVHVPNRGLPLCAFATPQVLESSVPSPRSRWPRGECRTVRVPRGNRGKAQNVEVSGCKTRLQFIPFINNLLKCFLGVTIIHIFCIKLFK